VEDILEEIVGEVRDEFDADEVAEIRTISEDCHYIVDAKVTIIEVNQLLGTHLTALDVDTIGGWFLTQNTAAQLGAGAVVEAEGYSFKVHEADGYHIMYLEIERN